MLRCYLCLSQLFFSRIAGLFCLPFITQYTASGLCSLFSSSLFPSHSGSGALTVSASLYLVCPSSIQAERASCYQSFFPLICCNPPTSFSMSRYPGMRWTSLPPQQSLVPLSLGYSKTSKRNDEVWNTVFEQGSIIPMIIRLSPFWLTAFGLDQQQSLGAWLLL